MQLPFSVYLGWITVATIANATTVLDYLDWNMFGLGEQAWFLIMLFAALAIAALMTWMRGDVAYLLVLAWAFAGIAVKHGDTATVTTASWIATAIVLVFVGISLVRRRHGLPTVDAVV